MSKRVHPFLGCALGPHNADRLSSQDNDADDSRPRLLGVGEKDVALPFAAVQPEKKNNKWYLTVDETKDTLKPRPVINTTVQPRLAHRTWAPDSR
jgi:hypothetical protein